MKTYEVEMRRTSYILITVEAESEEHAEKLAWTKLSSLALAADWEVESVELTQGEIA